MREKVDGLKVIGAEVCLVCDGVEEKDIRSIRPVVCAKCLEKRKAEFDHWNKNGLYLTDLKSVGEK